jgi:hypothetical protein
MRSNATDLGAVVPLRVGGGCVQVHGFCYIVDNHARCNERDRDVQITTVHNGGQSTINLSNNYGA